jgi:hypothetical protein
MKKSTARAGQRTELGRISSVTLGDIKGQVEAFGLYTPRIELN